jgi:hypothetical protein
MGCDIHAFVEYRRPGEKSWECFGGEHHLERCYALFSRLGGVRVQGSEDSTAERRGLPADASLDVAGHDQLTVVDELVADSRVALWDAVEEWLKVGAVRVVLADADGQPLVVSHPDHHSHSWCSPTELAKVLGAHDEGAPFQWGLMADLLIHIKEAGNEARMVFWFDS